MCADFPWDIPISAGWLVLAVQDQRGTPAEAQAQFYPLLILQLLRPYKMFHSPLTSTAPITARRRQKKDSS